VSTEATPVLRSSARVLRVAAAVGAVIAISLLRWDPQWSHALATCVVLVTAALVIPLGPTPTLVAPRRWIADAGPLGVGVIACGAGVLLLIGPLQSPVSVVTTPTPYGLILVLGIPVAEEAFFRGALLRSAPSRPVLAAIGSSLLFGALHWSLGPSSAALMVVFGGVLAAVALATRSWAIPAVLHACYNGLATAYREEVGLYVILPLAWAVGLSAASLLQRKEES
jgi:membrane protease YdiL (CAAX protease family)